MSCCPNVDFERHPNADVADIGKGGGAEFTIGKCTNCGALLVHSWAGGIVGGYAVVSREWIDHVVAAVPESRRAMLVAWYESAD